MYDNRNRLIYLLVITSVILTLFTFVASSHSEKIPSVSAKAAVLYEPRTKRFLYTKNEDERLGMASTTKIMTALIALENLPPEELITADSNAVGIEGSSIYLKPGETMRAIDLIYALILQSANDAAEVLAYRISGSIQEFAKLMNEKAQELGAKNTNFTNPHGLDDKEHYTTASDLAIITAKALENEAFREIASTKIKTVESSLTKRVLVNHNKLLKSYEGCIGVKTGFTKKTGRSLVSAADKDGLTLICVTINAPDDWSDHTKMLDFGYSVLEIQHLADVGSFSYEIPVINGKQTSVKISNLEPFSYISDKDGSEYKTEVFLSRYFSAPIQEGEVLGKVIFTKNGVEIGSIPLISRESIEIKKKNTFFLFDNNNY